MDLKAGVLKFIKEKKLTDKGDRILIGLSGGADSVCLSMILKALEKELDISVFAVHVNHSLRGQESDGDETFCGNLCQRLDIPFESVRIDVKGYSEEKKIGTEEAARILRYGAFEDVMKKFRCNKTATAHNRNDQAETVLFRLLRGSSSKGLSGIRPRRDEFIRPLLETDRSQIEEYLKENGQSYRTDSTNLKDDYTRNSIRLNLIPYLKENYNPDITGTLYELSEIMASDSEYLEKVAGKYSREFLEYDANKNEARLLPDLFKLEKAVTSRVILKAIEKVRGNTLDIDGRHIEDITDLAFSETGKSIDIPDLKVRNSYGTLIFSKNEEKEDEVSEIIIKREELENIKDSEVLKGSEALKVSFRGYDIEFRLMDLKKDEERSDLLKHKSSESIYMDFSSVRGDITLRTRRNGDKIKLKGTGGRKSIRSILIDKKVDRELRDRLPVLSDDREEVIYLHKGMLSEDMYLKDDTQKVLEVKIKDIRQKRTI